MVDCGKLAKSGSEHGEQVALFCWAAQQQSKWPELMLMFAIPNGGTRGDDEKARMIRGGQLKAEGVKPGVCDVLLPIARHGMNGLFIEMKVTSGGVVSEDQEKFIANVRAQGYGALVCNGWMAAVAVIEQYMS